MEFKTFGEREKEIERRYAGIILGACSSPPPQDVQEVSLSQSV